MGYFETRAPNAVQLESVFLVKEPSFRFRQNHNHVLQQVSLGRFVRRDAEAPLGRKRKKREGGKT